MRVDVLMAGNAPTPEQARFGTLCRTILQNIEVLSAGQKLDKTTDGKPESAQVVNLLVTPAQAEILNLAMSETKVQLVLRNPLDTTKETPPGTSIAGLFGAPGHVPIGLAPYEHPFHPPSVSGPPVHRPTAEASTTIAAQIPVAHIEVFRGVKKTEETFDLPTGKK
jgi:pilus assembly protein CpaB